MGVLRPIAFRSKYILSIQSVVEGVKLILIENLLLLGSCIQVALMSPIVLNIKRTTAPL